MEMEVSPDCVSRKLQGTWTEMKQSKFFFALAAVLVTLLSAHLSRAQRALPTATRTLQLSAFGGVSGNYTGLSGGKNLDITAGADLGLPVWHMFRPTIEVRGSYPVDKGTIDAQKSILAGAKAEFLVNHRLRPYGDFLFGRGQINYGNGYQYGNQVYLQTTTNVLSPGAGFDYDLSSHFSLRVDGQMQRWEAAPTPSGNIWAKVGTVALVYHFTFGPRNYPR